jgi:hypothetical protein
MKQREDVKMQSTRIESHIKAKQFIFNDDYVEALCILKAAVKEYGPHVGCLSDIASCYYMLNEYDQFSIYTKKLENEFEISHKKLSDDSFIKTITSLGKLQEECGQIYEAIKTYQKINERFEFSNDKTLSLYAQIMRLEVTWNFKNRNTEAYNFCLASVAEAEVLNKKELFFDVLHTLIISDIYENKILQASIRLRELEKSLNISGRQSDYRLIVFDVLYELLSCGQSVEIISDQIKKIDYLSCDSFEKILLNLLNILDGNDLSFKIIDIDLTGLSLISKLRILFVAKVICSSQEEKLYFETEFNRAIHLLSYQNRRLVLNKWKQADIKVTLFLDKTKLLLSKEDEQIQFEEDEFLYKLLLQFCSSNIINVDDAIKNIFNIHIDVYSVERLRVAVRRARSQLNQTFGLSHSILITKSELRLADSLILKSV